MIKLKLEKFETASRVVSEVPTSCFNRLKLLSGMEAFVI